MPTSEKLVEFYRKVAFYRYHDLFEVREHEYKIRLASVLAESRELIGDERTQALLLLRRALHSSDNNIINWRLQKRLTDWFANYPAKAAAALLILWDEDLDLANRFDAFAHTLEEPGLGQPGAQLVIGSTFLMGLSPFDFPPVRMEAFKVAMDFAGRNTLYTVKSAAERYLLARSFMDAIVEESRGFGIDLRDRLNAQGVIWCVADGWPNVPIPPQWSPPRPERGCRI